MPHQSEPGAFHLGEAARAALALPVEERVFFARQDHWIGYGEAKKALAAIEDLLRRPRTTTSPSLLLLGRPRNGKTTILERFVAQHPPVTRTTGDLTCEVVAMSMPPGASEKDFWSELLLACRVAHRVTDPTAVMKRQAYSVLKSLQPRILVSDELSNLLLGSGTDQRLVMAEIRDLTNKFKIHLVLAGTEIAHNATQSDPQIDGRLERYELPKWDLDHEFLRLLRSFEAVMPLPAPSNFASEELATDIYARTDGSIGSIARIVKEATALAIRQGRDRVDLETIRAIRVETSEARQLRARRL